MTDSNKQLGDLEGADERTVRSVFLDTLRARAQKEGKSVEQLLDEARLEATAQDSGLTEDCLFPDEVEQLLTSPNLALAQGHLAVRPGSVPTAVERDALTHVEGCTFCQPLLRLMSPRVEERARFLGEVRREAARRNSKPQPVDSIASPSRGWGGLRSYVPVLLPVAIGAYALSQSTASGSPLTQALWASSPIVVTVGALGGALGWVASNSTRLWPFQPGEAGARHTVAPTLVASFAATFLMLAVGLGVSYGTDRAVVSAQQTLLESAIVHMTGSRDAANPEVPGKDLCKASDSKSRTQTCRAVERLPVPGSVVGMFSESSADIYWEARGERLRELQLVKARVIEASDGAKTLSLASGGSVPLSSAAWGKYPVGTPLLAVKGEALDRVVQHFKADLTAAKYPLISAGVLSEQESK